jgi:hypothetical protein
VGYPQAVSLSTRMAQIRSEGSVLPHVPILVSACPTGVSL